MKFYKGCYDINAKISGLSYKSGSVSDSPTFGIADSTNQWVNDTGVFYVDNYTDITTSQFANFILGCMIYGVGAENIKFPTNGTISSSLKKCRNSKRCP